MEALRGIGSRDAAGIVCSVADGVIGRLTVIARCPRPSWTPRGGSESVFWGGSHYRHDPRNRRGAWWRWLPAHWTRRVRGVRDGQGGREMHLPSPSDDASHRVAANPLCKSESHRYSGSPGDARYLWCLGWLDSRLFELFERVAVVYQRISGFRFADRDQVLVVDRDPAK